MRMTAEDLNGLYGANELSGQELERLWNHIARLEREREALAKSVRALLLSADSSWEDRGEGHDWSNACESARKTMMSISEEINDTKDRGGS